jgi:plasmid stabilization system protein ParE
MALPRLRRRAVEQVAEAAEYLTRQSAELGEAFKRELRRVLESIQKTPNRYAKLETNRTDREIRRAILHRFRYLVVYEILNGEPVVLAVVHASRHPDFWQTEEERLPPD